MTTAHVTPLATPLTATDVTKNDHIWNKNCLDEHLLDWEKQILLETKKDEDTITTPGHLSPPLKHITTDWTSRLLQTLDPLDGVDSSSELSASSADTMIMMTSEEERRNDERIKNSFLDYEQRRNVLTGSGISTTVPYNSSRGVHYQQEDQTHRLQGYSNSRHPKQLRDFSSNQSELSYDDGYGTDSRSHTSASTSSPLSSSLSSLSTLEGSQNGFHFGGIPSNKSGQAGVSGPNANMQRGPIQKAPNPYVGGRNVPQKHNAPGVPVKRREVHVEPKDNISNLEDRLRALTTIEEEDSGLPLADRGLSKTGIPASVGRSGSFSPKSSPRDWRRNANVVSSGNGNKHNATGCYRAVPVEVVASNSIPGGDGYSSFNPSVDSREGRALQYPSAGSRGISPTTAHQNNGDGLRDYTRFLEKDCDIPLHNIDPAGRGKFSNKCVDNVPDMDINRRIGTGSPAHPKKQIFHDQRPSPSQMVESPLVQRRIGEQVISEPHQFPPSSVGMTGYTSGSGLAQGYQSRVMSSMPDLRGQDATSSPRLSQRNHQDSYPGYPFYKPTQYHQQLQQQQQFQQQQQKQQYQQQPQIFRHPQYDLPHREGSNSNSPSLGYSSQSLQSSSASNLFQHPAASGPTSYLGSHHPYDGEQNSRLEYSAPPTPQYPEVVLRKSRPASSSRATPSHHDRFSWQPSSSYQQQQQQQQHAEFGNIGTTPAERVSLDLGNIPQLQKQIRATSELCLQASRKHMFASSADIYKLFSGQRKVPPSRATPTSPQDTFSNESRVQPSRHSFHAMPRSMAASTGYLPDLYSSRGTDSPSSKPKLQVVVPMVTSPGPFRADHNLPIPPEAWTSVPPPTTGTTPTTLHPSSADELDKSPFQRQSSGYSSENELQQIEINAKAARKHHKKAKQNLPTSSQDFMPLHNTSIDQESIVSSSKDNMDDANINEPVYVNQPMLGRSGAIENLHNPELDMKQIPAGQFPSNSANLVPHINRSYSPSQAHQPPFSSMEPTNIVPSISVNNPQLADKHSKSTNANQPTFFTSGSSVTQNQVINFAKKPVTITSHVPSNVFYPGEENPCDRNSNPLQYTDSKAGQRIQRATPSPQNLGTETDFPAYPLYPNQGSGGNPLGYPSQPDFNSGRPGSSQGTRQRYGADSPTDQRLPTTNQGMPRPPRTSSNSSSSHQMSPLEIAQVLEVPFATSIISDEKGDRLSTLV